MKVLIRVPTNAGCHPLLTDWLVWMAWQADERIAPHTPIYDTKCFGIAEGRNDIVAYFMSTDCTHLWFIDSDVVPPLNFSILEHDEPILCGPYPGCWGEKSGYHVYNWIQTPKKSFWSPILKKDWPKDRLFHADAAGTGCMLIRRDVLEKKVDPFYFTRRNRSLATEDLTFCRDNGGVTVLKSYLCAHYRDINMGKLT